MQDDRRRDGGLAKAGNGAAVHVAPGTYAESATIDSGKSLLATGSAAQTIIDPAADPGVTVANGNPAGTTIRGFTMRSVNAPSLLVQGSATVTANVFDDGSTGFFVPDLRISDTSGTPTVAVTQNTFTDPNTADAQLGVEIRSTGNPQISDNTFAGFRNAIDLAPPTSGTAGTATISENEITGSHQNNGVGNAVFVLDTTATVTDNFIHSPGSGQVEGVSVFDSSSGTGVAGATLRRNRIFEHHSGVQVLDNGAAVTLDSDVLAGGANGLDASDTGSAGGGDVAATNITTFGNTLDADLQDNHLTLDSSIVGGAIRTVSGGGQATCTITHSRGPSTTPAGNGCLDFQTTEAPMFVNPAANDYHLMPTSPLIDLGDPAAPGGAASDFDGDARALDGNCDGTVRRDIGADEVVADCDPPETTISAGPAAGSVTGDSTPTFGFASDEPGSSFQCSVDGGGFAACSSPHTAAPLADGQHTLRARATDQAGNTDPTPAATTFSVDTRAPDTTITRRPRKKTTKRTAKFRFTADDSLARRTQARGSGLRFECKLDRKPFRTCSSPQTYRKLRRGRHRFQVRAIDRAGNIDQTPARRGWRIKRAPKKR